MNKQIKQTEKLIEEVIKALSDLPVELSSQLDWQLLNVLKKRVGLHRSAKFLYDNPLVGKIQYGKTYKVKFGDKPITYARFYPFSAHTFVAVWVNQRGVEIRRSKVGTFAANSAIIEEFNPESEEEAV